MTVSSLARSHSRARPLARAYTVARICSIAQRAGGATAGSRAAPEVLGARERFEKLLALAHVRPKIDVMARLLLARGTEMLLAKTADEALSIYEWAKNLPLSPTKGNFLKETGFLLDGPLSSHMGNLFMALGPTGDAYVLKVVPAEGDPEVVAAVALADAPAEVHLVRSRFCCAQRECGDKFCGLLMPYFTRSLASAELRLGHDILLARARDLVAAVNYIHSKGFVHMDMKEANIFVDVAGLWWLGDFGSCVVEGSPIRTTTPAYNPRNHAEGLRSEFWYDWHMLATLLLRQLGVKVDGSSSVSALSSAAAEVAATGGPLELESKALSSLLLHLLGLKSATG